jgi:protein-tyrosine phosphatase
MSQDKHVLVQFNKITEKIYIGTNLCCLTSSHTQVLRDEGIGVDIDMEIERQDATPEVEIYLWLPTEDKQAPTQDQLQTGVAVIDESVKLGKKVYVHCRNGHGRGPTMVAAYLVYEGAGVKEAIKKIKEKRPEIHLEKVQLQALHTYRDKIS